MSVAMQQKLKTNMVLGAHQLMGLRLLARSLPELRAEVIREIESNPAIEEIDHPLETPISEVEGKSEEQNDFYTDNEDFEPLARREDEEAVERRQAFFDNQPTREETLQQHLCAQLPLSDLPVEDRPLAEILIGDLDANGYYRGSIADAAMVFSKSEAQVLAVLRVILQLDPVGCGARDYKECLSAQLGTIDDLSVRSDVAWLIDHLEDVAAGKVDVKRYASALKALRSLEPHPGRAFPSEKDRVEYVNPEIHAFKDSAGHWCALTDKRSLPEIRISKKFEALLNSPDQTAETKAYVRERIEHAQALQAAIVHRQESVENIAQAIFDRQQGFFEDGFKALKPLTETEIAEAVGVNATTVSRTVRDKYAETPKGTIELRRFFSSGVVAAGGETVSQQTVLDCLKQIVENENRLAPLSDEALAREMKSRGFPIARRTVAKYRDKLSIPAAAARATSCVHGVPALPSK